MQASDQAINSEDVIVLMSSLVERSLVTYDEDSHRYSMLETVRHYSRERLLDTGEGPGLRAKHAANVLELLRRLNRITDFNEALRMMPLINAELDNIRGAAMYTIAAGDIASTTTIVRTLGSYWLSQGNTEEPIALLRMALEPHIEGPLDRLQADALLEMCSFEYTRDASARSNALRALDEWERLGGSKEIAECHRLLGNIAIADEKVEDAEQHYKKALDGAEGADLIARILGGLASVAISREDWEEARSCFESMTSEVPGIRIGAMVNLAWIDIKQGKLDLARDRLLQFGEIVVESRAPIGIPTFAVLAAEYFGALQSWNSVPALLSLAARTYADLDAPISGFETRTMGELASRARSELGATFDTLWPEGESCSALNFIERTMESIRGSVISDR